jgi:hypothetical protein
MFQDLMIRGASGMRLASRHQAPATGECRALKEGVVTEEHENSTDKDRHIGTADRRTIDSIFHHPVPHNLSWADVLYMLRQVGSAEEKADGKFSLQVGGKHLVFHKPHGKHLDAREIDELRHYLASAGISKDVYGAGAPPPPAPVDVVVVMDHHEAKLYQILLSSDQHPQTVRPYDPHHFLHHLHHRDELRERGQRPAEDLTFYDRIAEALRETGRIILLCHGKGVGNAGDFFTERLKKHHSDIYARVVLQARVDTSAMTEPQILAYARTALVVGPSEQS